MGMDAPEQGEADVDQDIGSAAGDDEDAHGRDWDFALAELPLRSCRGCSRGLLTEEGDEDEEDDAGSAGHVCDELVGRCKRCGDLDQDLDLEIGF